jgi:N utilization substance protein A
MSRTSEVFREVIWTRNSRGFDGLIMVKNVVRIPVKSKSSCGYLWRQNRSSACVGMKGSRIHGIVSELGNENIDVLITQAIFNYLSQEL